MDRSRGLDDREQQSEQYIRPILLHGCKSAKDNENAKLMESITREVYIVTFLISKCDGLELFWYMFFFKIISYKSDKILKLIL